MFKDRTTLTGPVFPSSLAFFNIEPTGVVFQSYSENAPFILVGLFKPFIFLSAKSISLPDTSVLESSLLTNRITFSPFANSSTILFPLPLIKSKLRVNIPPYSA